MAKLNVYTIYDRVAEECGPLVSAKNDGIAWRMFIQATSKMMTDRSELQLVHVACFHDSTCVIEPVHPTRIVTSPSPLEEQA